MATCAAAPWANAQKPVDKAAIDTELSRLVIEAGTGVRIENGVLSLRADGGWARTRRLISDFALDAEFKLLSPSTALQIGIRTINTETEWPQRGYRLAISPSARAALTANGHRLRTLKAVRSKLAEAEWHSLTIKGVGQRIEISIDGGDASVHEIDIRTGSILFQAERGDAEVRGVKLTFPSPSLDVVRPGDYKGRPEFTQAKLVREAKPSYTRAALEAGLEGVIHFEAVVLADGSVGFVRLMSLLDPGLEHAALDAVRRWKFSPARLNGVPVAMQIEIEMSFSRK